MDLKRRVDRASQGLEKLAARVPSYGRTAKQKTHSDLPVANKEPFPDPNVDIATNIGMSHAALGITRSAHV